MKLGQLKIDNVQGIRHLDVTLAAAPVTLFAGGNHVGKSTLADCLRMAIRGETPRVKLKKDYGQMVRDGAKKGSVSLTCDDGITRMFALPKGEWSENEADSMTALTLDMHKFSSLDDATKRKVIFRITGMNPTPDAIAKRLVELGCESDKVNKVKALILTGVEGANKEAKTATSQARGAWEQITGTKYGIDKAQDWKAARPEYDADAHAAALQELEELNADRDKQADALIRAENDYRAMAESQQKRDELLSKSSMIPRIEAKLNASQMELGRVTAYRDNLRQRAEGPQEPRLFHCPSCSASLHHDSKDPGARLLEYIKPEFTADPDAVRKLPEADASVDMMIRTVANDTANLDAAKKAKAELDALGAVAGDQKTILQIIDGQRLRIQAIKSERAKVESEVYAMNAAKLALEQANTKEADAAARHADIVAWTKIAEHLAPDGVISEFLTNALRKVNSRLAQSAADSQWPVVVITPDMEITYGGRLYGLCSESEKWRADAMITEAISNLSGLRMMVLDRMDVLEPADRTSLIVWMDILVEDLQALDTCIVMATLKEPPKKLPACFQCFWMADGEIVEPDTEKQAA